MNNELLETLPHIFKLILPDDLGWLKDNFIMKTVKK